MNGWRGEINLKREGITFPFPALHQHIERGGWREEGMKERAEMLERDGHIQM